MIEGNTLKFGYGDIAVRTTGLKLTLVPFKPPVEVGTHCTKLFESGEIEAIGEPIHIEFTDFKDFKELQKKLEDVYENKIFEFKGYIFDFTNYNKTSVEIIEYARKFIYTRYLKLSAC